MVNKLSCYVSQLLLSTIQRSNGHNNETLYAQTYDYTHNRDHIPHAQPVLSDIPGQIITIPTRETGRVVLPPVSGRNNWGDRSSALIHFKPSEHSSLLRVYIENDRLYLKFNDPRDLTFEHSRNNTFIRVQDEFEESGWPTREERESILDNLFSDVRGNTGSENHPGSENQTQDSQVPDSQERNQNSQVNDSQAPQESQDSQARNPDPDPDSAAPSSPEDQDEEALFEDDCAPTEALSSVEHHLSDRSEVTWDCKLADASYQEEQDNLRYARDLQQAIENSLPIPTVIVTHKSKPTATTDALSSAPTTTTPPRRRRKKRRRNKSKHRHSSRSRSRHPPGFYTETQDQEDAQQDLPPNTSLVIDLTKTPDEHASVPKPVRKHSKAPTGRNHPAKVWFYNFSGEF